jgi:CIC family chloride channel protein
VPINGQPRTFSAEEPAPPGFAVASWPQIVGPVTLSRRPQTLFVDEDLEQARRQLVVYGRDGLPVLTHDGQLQGWLTRADILSALTTKLATTEQEIRDGAAAIETSAGQTPSTGPMPTRPLPGYELLEVRVQPDSPALGRTIAEVRWPAGSAVVAVTHGREVHAAAPELRLHAGERVLVLTPVRDVPAVPAEAEL